MFSYNENYPHETGIEYLYNEGNIEEHPKIILGRKNEQLERKLTDFFIGDIITNSEINFNKFEKRDSNFDGLYVEKMFGKGYLGIGKYDLFSDSPYAYLLRNNEGLGAILSFEPRPNAIMINQIQGQTFQREIWGDLKYPDLLIDICYNDFKDLKIPEIWILPYFRNKWIDVRENFQNTKKRQYDIPAKRQGFNFDDKRGIWVKSFLE